MYLRGKPKGCWLAAIVKLSSGGLSVTTFLFRKVLFGLLLHHILCEWLHYRVSAERLLQGHTEHLLKSRTQSALGLPTGLQ